LIIFWHLSNYLLAICQELLEGVLFDGVQYFRARNNSQREQLPSQMALNCVQIARTQWDIDVQMCQPAKRMGQFGENAAKTHLNIKITE
jgi:hypothetical protein